MTVDWRRVDRLVDDSRGLQDLRVHGLQLLAAHRWRGQGVALPPDLVNEELQALWRTAAAPRVLEEVRAICDGPVMLVKGPAVAAHFPEPATRPFLDLDLLVPDARAAHGQLVAAGFEYSADPADYPDDLHHLPPVHSPRNPIPIELHSRLKWVEGLRAPTFEMLAGEARADALGVDGVVVPSIRHHALVLAGHLWAHDPLARLLRLLDIAVLADADARPGIEAVAAQWGLTRLWRATAAAADALFAGAPRDPWPLRTWARGLRSAREPTVAEVHLSRLLSPFAIYPPRRAGRALGSALAGFALPQAGEPWRRKVQRTAEQVLRPAMPRSEHRRAIEHPRHGASTDAKG